jgi:hypothetical protein
LVVQKFAPIFHSFFCFGSFAESNLELCGTKLGSSAARSSVFENWGGGGVGGGGEQDGRK